MSRSLRIRVIMDEAFVEYSSDFDLSVTKSEMFIQVQHKQLKGNSNLIRMVESMEWSDISVVNIETDVHSLKLFSNILVVINECVQPDVTHSAVFKLTNDTKRPVFLTLDGLILFSFAMNITIFTKEFNEDNIVLELQQSIQAIVEYSSHKKLKDRSVCFEFNQFNFTIRDSYILLPNVSSLEFVSMYLKYLDNVFEDNVKGYFSESIDLRAIVLWGRLGKSLNDLNELQINHSVLTVSLLVGWDNIHSLNVLIRELPICYSFNIHILEPSKSLVQIVQAKIAALLIIGHHLRDLNVGLNSFNLLNTFYWKIFITGAYRKDKEFFVEKNGRGYKVPLGSKHPRDTLLTFVRTFSGSFPLELWSY